MTASVRGAFFYLDVLAIIRVAADNRVKWPTNKLRSRCASAIRKDVAARSGMGYARRQVRHKTGTSTRFMRSLYVCMYACMHGRTRARVSAALWACLKACVLACSCVIL